MKTYWDAYLEDVVKDRIFGLTPAELLKGFYEWLKNKGVIK